MARTKSRVTRTAPIPIRFYPSQAQLVEQAAELAGMNRTDFMREVILERCRKIVAAGQAPVTL
ncbi:MAG TPA: DUF1778 domain-containing protein [Longimicrobiaceae bacterium]|nr:DUF1778 domain-containing protein [Longimicrobiaceae bacterium]